MELLNNIDSLDLPCTTITHHSGLCRPDISVLRQPVRKPRQQRQQHFPSRVVQNVLL